MQMKNENEHAIMQIFLYIHNKWMKIKKTTIKLSSLDNKYIDKKLSRDQDSIIHALKEKTKGRK